jgi:hypothetical protein
VAKSNNAGREEKGSPKEMNIMPKPKTMAALLESMIDSCLFLFNEPRIEANESFVPVIRKDTVIVRNKILKIGSDIRKVIEAKITNTTKLIPVKYLK